MTMMSTQETRCMLKVVSSSTKVYIQRYIQHTELESLKITVHPQKWHQ